MGSLEARYYCEAHTTFRLATRSETGLQPHYFCPAAAGLRVPLHFSSDAALRAKRTITNGPPHARAART